MRIIATTAVLISILAGLIVATLTLGPTLSPPATSSLSAVVILAGIISILCFAVSELNGNYSQVDKIWSLAPIAYVWIITWHGGFTLRLILMSILVTLWGCRLTFNFWLKGGYSWKIWQGAEDYRWQVLKKNPALEARWKWSLFNLLFISGFQNALILMMTLPVVIAVQFNDEPLNWLDGVATVTILFLVVYESLADWQQWRYQANKNQRHLNGEAVPNDVDPGFLNQGLWALSRHPNYFAEQGIWVVFYLFSVAASGLWLNWSIAGWLLLIALFRGSSNFSEEISVSKYPAYKTYQETIPRFLPIGKKLF
jgi:steroid 5-alpha reductase family enzyme